MTRDTLRSRTVRSSLRLLQENLRDLRAYAEDFDPDQIDRLTKAAELTSTTIKKLLAYISEEPKNVSEPAPAGGTDLVDVVALNSFLAALNKKRICPACGGLLPSGGSHGPHDD